MGLEKSPETHKLVNISLSRVRAKERTSICSNVLYLPEVTDGGVLSQIVINPSM